MQDLNNKVTGGTLTAAEWNEVPSEIQNVIEGLGITLSGADLNQLGKAIAGYVANGTFYTDSGAADAYVLTTIGSKQSPTAYTDGLQIRFSPGNSNAGATTVNVAALGVKNIFTDGGVALAGGEIISGEEVICTFDLANDRFTLTTPALFSDFAGTSNSLAGSGFQKFPGGLIVQWGSVTAISPHAVVFPLTFPTAVFIVSATQFNNAVLGNNTVDSNAITVTGFTAGVFVGSTGAGNTRNISFIAIGH